MEAVDIRKLYDSDPRPTFILDCHAPSAAIYHVNTALLGIPQVALSLHSHNALRDWWDPASKVAARHKDEFCHGRYRWAKFTACERWLVVTIVEQPPITDEPRGILQEPAQLSQITSPSNPRPDTIFTAKIQSPELREHIEYVRLVDWSSTSLGPISSWSYELNVLITTMMLDTRPTALFLGPELVLIYNLAYGTVSGSRHPKILGKGIIDAWSRSQQTRFADAPEEEYHFMVERNGFLDECFFMCSLTSLFGIGTIDGIHSIVTEVTKERLLERRISALLRVSQLSSAARDSETFWTSLREAVEPYEYDFPAAILYSQSVLDTTDSLASCDNASVQCLLEWAVGYAVDHPAIPKVLNIGEEHGLARAMSGSANNGAPTLLREEDGVLPDSLFTDVEQRAFGDPCRAFIVIPVKISDETITGYLIIALNTRRPYDAEYQDWIQVFSKFLGASAASLALHEKELRNRRREDEQAAKLHEALNAEVAVLTQEASDNARKLQNFHDLTNEVGLGYFEFNTSGKLIHANETFFAQTGHRRDLASAPPFSYLERIHERDRNLSWVKWHDLVDGNPTTFEMRWRRESDKHHGSDEKISDYVTTLCACVPIKSKDGTVTGMFGCNTDISAQKEATMTALLKMEAERLLASFTELAPVGLYQLDADLVMKYCNDQWFRITGHPRVPMDQIEWRSIVHKDDLEGVYRDVEVAARTNAPHSFSWRLQQLWTAPDGISTPTWILSTIIVHNDEHGNMISTIGTLTDVSQLKWSEAIQKTRVEEALESKRQQENFIDMTSHEMRNPLSAMVQCADSISSSLGEMEILTREETLAAQPTLQTGLKELITNSLDAIDTIQACAMHQKRIVDDILTLSKIDSKLLVISPIIIQPSTLLQNAYKMFKDVAIKASVELKVSCDASIADMGIDWVALDPSRVLQVLINLLTNAIKFTRGQAVRKVEVIMGASLQPEQKPEVDYVPQQALRQEFLAQRECDSSGEFIYLSFTVRDTGCGLSPDQKVKLFLRFSQASPKTHIQYGGSGLGLFISRELTEMQGGSIGVASTQGVGSTFSFYIKSQRAQSPRSHPTPPHTNTIINKSISSKADESHQASPSNAPLSNVNAHLPFYHILVVEDNLINQRVLCKQLRKLSHTVHIANHGLEALTLIAMTTFAAAPTHEPPLALSVVLMDVEMPIMDGLTCTRRIRAMERTGELVGHVPIIAVSANARREQIEQALRAGVDDSISKPFRIGELMELIRRFGVESW
ncbi:hypothetical protein EJ02DRAFT_399475 [Clathrospora elynae]|uniref:Aerobic respiration control sensor protein arcB n=1 Tax=Clathrospora elynae TaxID=706981 RepID=A0A6A5SZY9_9PLEO|nr:hypothetical protein EJ02DRAFT_399475 [Clathrospora elynae]